MPQQPGPGKFEACSDARMARVLFDMAQAGDLDEYFGSVQESEGWFGLVISNKWAYILMEDGYGFFTYTRFPREEGVRLWLEARETYYSVGIGG